MRKKAFPVAALPAVALVGAFIVFAGAIQFERMVMVPVEASVVQTDFGKVDSMPDFAPKQVSSFGSVSYWLSGPGTAPSFKILYPLVVAG